MVLNYLADAKIEDPHLLEWLNRYRISKIFPGWTRAEIDGLDSWEIMTISAILQGESKVAELRENERKAMRGR